MSSTALNSSAPAAIAWSSRLMFILAAVGSAVGLGNIWKFPYIVGENGGGAFVLVYLVCLAALGLPILIAEIAIGRRGGERPATAFVSVAEAAGLSKRWGLLGHSAAVACMLILFFYAVVTGWVGVYALHYAAAAAGLAPSIADGGAYFTALTHNAAAQFAALIAIAGFGYLIVRRNAVRSVEKAMLFMAPVFVLLLGGLAILAAVAHPAPTEIVRYLLAPDFSALTPAAVGEAIGHAFFTLSIGLCCMVVYGAYLGRDANVPRLGLAVAFVDTAVSMTCAFIVFGIAFAAGANPAQGPGLIFAVLPAGFAMTPGGDFIGAAFFFAVLIAAFSSVVALMIVATRSIEETFAVSATIAARACSLAVVAGGAAVIASTSELAQINIFGLPLLDALDTLTSSIMLPLCGIGIAVFAGRALRAEFVQYRYGAVLLFCLRWVAPLALIAVIAGRVM